MRTLLQSFRREKTQPREYHPSVRIKIGADSIGVDSLGMKCDAIRKIDVAHLWHDKLDNCDYTCDFVVDRQNDCLVSRNARRLVLTKSQLVAYENHIRTLCEEVRKVSSFNLQVFDVEGTVTFTKCVYVPSWKTQ